MPLHNFDKNSNQVNVERVSLILASGLKVSKSIRLNGLVYRWKLSWRVLSLGSVVTWDN